MLCTLYEKIDEHVGALSDLSLNFLGALLDRVADPKPLLPIELADGPCGVIEAVAPKDAGDVVGAAVEFFNHALNVCNARGMCVRGKYADIRVLEVVSEIAGDAPVKACLFLVASVRGEQLGEVSRCSRMHNTSNDIDRKSLILEIAERFQKESLKRSLARVVITDKNVSPVRDHRISSIAA